MARAVAAGERRSLSVELPPEAEPLRAEVRGFVDELQAHDRSEWRRRFADAGYLAPHWPRPWGRDASPVEQLVIDQELRAARVGRAHLAIADCVVGSPTEGWVYARTTLANERVSMAEASSFGPGVSALFELAESEGLLADPLVLDRLGGLVVDAHAIALLGLRTTLRALGGGQRGHGPGGPEASVRKLAAVEHEQAVQEAGLALLGPEAALTDGRGGTWTTGFLGNRALSIAGGTSEIQRNVIAERLLGMPKDP